MQRIDPFAALEVERHPIGELVDDPRQCFLRERGRPGRHVHHAEARFDLDHRRQLVVPATHVDRGVDTGLGQRRHQLAHIHVHAARVTLAGLQER